MTKCEHCPFLGDPKTACVVERTRHERLCRRADPASPLFRPDGAEAVRRLTLEPLGRWEPPPAPPERTPVLSPPQESQAMPSLARQAGHLVGDLATAAASGFRFNTPEEAARRLAICGACEHYTGSRCRKCGCWMAARTKQAAWRCPIGKF